MLFLNNTSQTFVLSKTFAIDNPYPLWELVTSSVTLSLFNLLNNVVAVPPKLLPFVINIGVKPVVGSNVMGPMGNELIPFKDETSAKDFSKDHVGKKILKFEEITLESIPKHH